jgi:hypothetical protein
VKSAGEAVTVFRMLLKDRKRSQRGSVLSGVLIMVAFLAIISGALMTALSTNFLLSNDLLNRVQTQATVSSAVEVAINQLQNTRVNAGCPVPASVSVNRQTAIASVATCSSVTSSGSDSFISMPSSNPFRIDGTLAAGLNDYVVGDSAGTVFDYPLGDVKSRWKLPLGGSVTAQPLVMPAPGGNGKYLDLVPASGGACGQSPYCVRVLADGGSNNPQKLCAMATAGQVVSQPAVGRNNPGVVFVGDSTGSLYALDTLDTLSGAQCSVESTASADGPIVAGPIAFPCQGQCSGSNADALFVLISRGGSAELEPFIYSSNRFSAAGPKELNLSWANPEGMDVESTTLPSRLAISFDGGQVAVVQIDGSGNLTLQPFHGQVSGGISAAPRWCHCPGPLNLIGVGGNNGALNLYLPDTKMNLYASYPGTSGISTTPVADGAGNWYFAANDGRLYEVNKAGGTTLALAASFGSARAGFTSSPVLGSCQSDVCVYLASTDSAAYLVDLDARNVVLTACIGTQSSGCSGVNPQLWTRFEVGGAVHVQGWSYYSP